MVGSSQRPLSPHLQVYRPQLTSVLSICHRISGLFNLLALVLICVYLVSLMLGESAYTRLSELLSSGLGRSGLFLITLSLSFHLSNGVRHLLWDFGKCLSLKQVTMSGLLVIITSLSLALLIFSCGYSHR